MFSRSADSDFRRFQASGDPTALARVFDRTAPELLRVARHLAATSAAGEREAGAEDLVQATYLTAIESAADHDGQRPVLPWLLGVLANHARVARRKAKRKVDPESALRVLDVDDPVERAARSELRDELDAAIRSLPEPYRPVLTLWFEHGLEPTEIGRALERPAGTVRAQVARGLERLRRALPKEFAAAGVAVAGSGVLASRGLAAVRTEVLQRCGSLSTVGKSGAATAAVASGVLTMMGSKVLVLGTSMVLLALVLGAGFWFGGGGAEMDGDANAGMPSVATAEFEDRVDETVQVPVAATRSEVEEKVPADVVAEPTEAEVPELKLHIVRAADGTPVVETPVQLTRLTQVDYTRPTRAGRTDAEGRVAFLNPPTGQVLVQLPHVGGVRAVDVAESSQTIVVEIPEGITVRGRVTDEVGRSVVGARVTAYGTLLMGTEVATSDERGEFVLQDVAVNVALEARDAGHGPSLAHPIAGQPGQEVEVELRLGDAGCRVVGRVLQPDGQPAPNAQVVLVSAVAQVADMSVPHERSSVTIADDQGRFEMRIRSSGEGRSVAIAIPRDRDTYAPSVAAIPAGPGSEVAVDISLRAGAVVEGRVNSTEKLPAGAMVQAWAAEPEDTFGVAINLIGIRMVQLSADGTFRLAGLPAGKSDLTIRTQTGQALGQAGWNLADGETRTWELDLDAGSGIRAKVSPARVDVDGAIPQWQAKVYRVAEVGREFAGYQSVGADGLVRFQGLDPAADYEIQLSVLALAAGGRVDCGVATFGPFRVGEEVRSLEVGSATMPSASVTGRLVDSDGNARGGVAVLLSRQLATSSDPVSYAQITTDSDGGFEFRPLVAGAWRMMHAKAGRPQILATIPALVHGEAHQLGDVTLK